MRMRSRSILGLSVHTGSLALLSSLLLFGSHVAWASDVRVYTDAAHPVGTPAKVHVIYLDASASIRSELSQGLPKDAVSAAQVVRKRMGTRGETFTRRLSDSYRGVIEAWSLGVLKLPAIVVDGRYVVYGDTNVVHAISLIDQYRGLKH